MITYSLLHKPTMLIVFSSSDKRDFDSVCSNVCEDVNFREVVSDEEEELPILDML